MRKIDRVIVMKHWIDSVKNMLNEQQMQEFSYAILMYGLYEEYHKSNDVAVQMALNFVWPQIDMMIEGYEEKREMGKKMGRKKTVDDTVVWQMFQEGKKAPEIAKLLDKPPQTIYSSEGWRERFNKDYLEERENKIFDF